MNRNRHQGFSLIELMVVVVIIGVLASIAYSSYTAHVIETRRSDAKSALSQLANVQEKFFTECNRYAALMTNNAAARTCSTSAAPGNATLLTNGLSPEGHYVIRILDPAVIVGNPPCTTSNCFILEADPDALGASGLQAGDGRFRIDQAGRKSWDNNNAGLIDANGMFTAGGWNVKKLTSK